MKVLVTGIANPIGRTVAELLLAEGHSVIGIDRRRWVAPKGIEMFAVDVRKRAAEDVFRKSRPDAIVHMATVTHLTERSEDRYRINLGGTRAVFDHAHAYGAKQVVFVGRHTYYGAAADLPLYHTEEEPPMAATTFPELADLVAADLYAGAALWRMPAMSTAVLRICYSLGREGQGTLAKFLGGAKAGSRVPTILGFDPLFQFMDERDVARAIALAVTKQLRGVYNVAGPQPVPLSVLIAETGRKRLPVPEALFVALLGRFGLPRLPPGAVAHIKFPIVVDAARFREVTGFAHEHDETSVMKAFSAR
jgi:UDP-glucose 4-epimerase